MRIWDLVLTIVLSLLLVPFTIIVASMGAMTAMASDGCGQGCNEGLLGLGVYTSMFGPALAALAAIVWAVVRLVQRRLSFWVPLAGAGAAVLVFLVGALITMLSVPGSFG